MEARKSIVDDFPPEQLDLLRVLGYHHLQNGSSVRAAHIFEALQALHPEDAGISLSLACALLRSEQLDQAMLVLESIPGSQAGSALAWLLRGQVLTRNGHSGSALVRVIAKPMRYLLANRESIPIPALLDRAAHCAAMHRRATG